MYKKISKFLIILTLFFSVANFNLHSEQIKQNNNDNPQVNLYCILDNNN